MPDRLSYVRAAIAAETASRSAEAEAGRMRAQGFTGAALALDALARSEAQKAARLRADATSTATRSTVAWRGHRLPRPRGSAPGSTPLLFG